MYRNKVLVALSALLVLVFAHPLTAAGAEEATTVAIGEDDNPCCL